MIHILCLNAEHLIDRKTTTDNGTNLAVGQHPECRPQLKFQIIILKAHVCHLAQIVGFILLTTFLIECQHRLQVENLAEARNREIGTDTKIWGGAIGLNPVVSRIVL